MIRPISPKDIPDCVSLYNHYIRSTTVTFEFDALTEAQFSDRALQISEQYPFYVYEDDDNGRILGYAYLSPYSERKAYRFVCDLSIYVAADVRSQGIGHRLYEAIEAEAYRRGFYAIIAVVTGENTASMAFHERQGFVLMAEFENMGHKFGRWLGVRYYRKNLRIPESGTQPDELIPAPPSDMLP